MKSICLSLVTIIFVFTLFSTSPVFAGSEGTTAYYDYHYSVEIQKSQIFPNEAFWAHVHSEGTCQQDLPVAVNGAIISGKIIAQLQGQKIDIVLNPEFSVQFDSIPGEKGQTFQKDLDIPLIFPGNSQQGKYDIIAQTTAAAFKVFGVWLDGFSYLPSEPVSVGSIECINDDVPVSTPTVSNVEVIPPETTESTRAASSDKVSDGGFKFWMLWVIAAMIVIVGLVIWRTLEIRRKSSG